MSYLTQTDKIGKTSVNIICVSSKANHLYSKLLEILVTVDNTLHKIMTVDTGTCPAHLIVFNILFSQIIL
jgi:hypothetical protein